MQDSSETCARGTPRPAAPNARGFKVGATLSFAAAVTYGEAGAMLGKTAAVLQGAILFPFPHPLEPLLTPRTGISSRSQHDFAQHNPLSLSRLRTETLLLEAFTPFPPHIHSRRQLLTTHFYIAMTLRSA